MAHKRSLSMRAALPGGRVFAFICCAAAASLLFIATSFAVVRAEGGAGISSSSSHVGGGSEMPVDGKTLIVRLRSFAPRASGRLEVEPTPTGGRVRLTAVNLPAPQSLAPNARTFVAWASGGRIVRLGELRRGARGGGSLVFMHPVEFTHYSLIVTAEQSAKAERPTGAPLFSTRANEVAALFPARDNTRADSALRERRTTTTTTTTATTRRNAPAADLLRRQAETPTNSIDPPRPSPAPTTAATTALRTRGRAAAAADEFFTEIDEAIKRDTTARTLTLVGDRGARGARGTARVAMADGTAYVRVRFRRVPSASRFGKGRRYAMWALIPADGTVYMGSLPTRNLNRRQTYARTEGVGSNKFRLLVTAERRSATPAARPRGRRVLMTFKGRRKK